MSFSSSRTGSNSSGTWEVDILFPPNETENTISTSHKSNSVPKHSVVSNQIGKQHFGFYELILQRAGESLFSRANALPGCANCRINATDIFSPCAFANESSSYRSRRGGDCVLDARDNDYHRGRDQLFAFEKRFTIQLIGRLPRKVQRPDFSTTSTGEFIGSPLGVAIKDFFLGRSPEDSRRPSTGSGPPSSPFTSARVAAT